MSPTPPPDFRFSLWLAGLSCLGVSVELLLLPAPFDGVRPVCTQVALLMASAWFVRRRAIASTAITGPLPSWRVCARWAGLTIALAASQLACAAFILGLGVDISKIGSSPVDDLMPFPAQVFVVACVIAPLTEELAFRGLLLRNLLQRVAPRNAVLLSALAFGLLHSSAFGIPQFVTGLLLALAYLATGSLWLSVAMHALMNALAILLEEGPLAAGAGATQALEDIARHLPHGVLWAVLCVIAGGWAALFTRWLRALPPRAAGATGDVPVAAT